MCVREEKNFEEKIEGNEVEKNRIARRNYLDLIIEDYSAELHDIPKYKRVVTYNSDSEILSDSTRSVFRPNGRGFVISYTEKMCEFLETVSTGSVVRVFLYIAHHQQYGKDGKTYGYRCSHKYLQKVLNIDKSTLWDALKVLKDSFLVNEIKIDGQTEFMVNPNYVTIGTDKKARLKEWSRRWQLYFISRNVPKST